MSPLYNHLQDQHMMQCAATTQALAAAKPRILAAEALAERLTELGRESGISAHPIGELDADGCTVIVHVDGRLDIVLQLLDFLAVPVEIMDCTRDGALRAYQATVFGRDVALVVRQPAPASLTRMAA